MDVCFVCLLRTGYTFDELCHDYDTLGDMIICAAFQSVSSTMAPKGNSLVLSVFIKEPCCVTLSLPYCLITMVEASLSWV